MILDKTHDPRQNGRILAKINNLNLKETLRDAELLFKECFKKKFTESKDTVQSRVPLSERLYRLIAKQSVHTEPPKIILDKEGNVFPDWKEKLDREYDHLIHAVTKEVNVVDFGAVGDGKTDCTAAFKKAIGNGRVKVVIPPGVYVTKGIEVPSLTILNGSGKGSTIVMLHHQAPKGTRLVTNASHWKGNHHIFINGLTLDWNVERLRAILKTSTWGNHSSCLTFANVTYGWVKDVEAINPGLHCFDISSTLYNYGGDGWRGRGGSSYVWLENLTGYGFGDDGITTHHSDYIYIGNCHMCDPSGRAHRKGFSNSNGFEIDDGSRNVLLVNNSSARCFGGIEIKAHQNSSAAANVQIVGHLSENDNRSFNFRHIGHHKSTDSESKTAYNIMAVNLAAIKPVFTDLYKGSTPRGMVISAYKNVVIHGFTLIGDSGYDYGRNPLIAVQYRARKIVLKNISIRGFKTVGPGIKVYGGENRADYVRIIDISIDRGKPLKIGKGVKNIEAPRGLL